MKIKRKFEMLVATSRRYTIRQSAPGRQIACAECGEPMLTAEQTADFFGVKQRRVFQIIETEAAHFTEIEAGGGDDLPIIFGDSFGWRAAEKNKAYG